MREPHGAAVLIRQLEVRCLSPSPWLVADRSLAATAATTHGRQTEITRAEQHERVENHAARRIVVTHDAKDSESREHDSGQQRDDPQEPRHEYSLVLRPLQHSVRLGARFGLQGCSVGPRLQAALRDCRSAPKMTDLQPAVGAPIAVGHNPPPEAIAIVIAVGIVVVLLARASGRFPRGRRQRDLNSPSDRYPSAPLAAPPPDRLARTPRAFYNLHDDPIRFGTVLPLTRASQERSATKVAAGVKRDRGPAK